MCRTQEPHEVVTDYARNLIRLKARQLARRPEFRTCDQQDIEQDLWVRLLSQAQRFDPARGSVNAFIVCVVSSGVAMLVRKRKRGLRSPDADAQSLDLGTVDSEGQPVPLREAVSTADVDRRTGGMSRPDEDVRDENEAFVAAQQLLSPLQLKVCDQLATGNTAHAARVLGLTRRKLQANVAAIRQPFEQAGFGEI